MEEKIKETFEYKCPSCGGKIKFDSDTQKMKCPFCDSELDVEALKSYDEILNNEESRDPEWGEQEQRAHFEETNDTDITSYVCNSCGGEIITDANTSATHCPYCDNPVIIRSRLSGQLKPDLVIPFKLDKKDAMDTFKKFLKNKPLLPRSFKDIKRFDEVMGTYVPFWLFNCDTNANIRYKATKVRTWSDSNYIYTRTSHYCLLRSGSMSFDNVPVDGSVRMDDTLMESIEPFDMSAAVDFQSAYLSGFLADKYDIDSKKAQPRANDRIKSSVASALADTAIGYTTVYPESSNIRVDNAKINYALLPVWILNTKYKGKTYTFAMNGQTGKFTGKLPIDKAKVFMWFLGVFSAVAVAVTLLAKFL